LRLLALPGLVFAAITFVVGDYVAPYTEREAVAVKAGVRGSISLGSGGAWMKERRPGTGAPAADTSERSISVNVGAAGVGGALVGVRIFEFDTDGRLRTRLEAERGQVLASGHWQLRQVQRTDWPTPEAAQASQPLRQQQLDVLDWPSTLDATVVAAALLPAKNMSTLDLWRYTNHLADQDQAVQSHQIQFWKKALYPLACVVMVALALPFAYLHARAGGVSYKVFGGIMLGISFVLLNNASGHLGLLRQWTPWMAAAAPSGLYLLISMGAFAWLVRFR
jgi:lipopolysaccharide export system permease protein